jgi:hypothetical protein
MLVTTQQTTSCHNPEDYNLNCHRHENLKSHTHRIQTKLGTRDVNIWTIQATNVALPRCSVILFETISRFRNLQKHLLVACNSLDEFISIVLSVKMNQGC